MDREAIRRRIAQLRRAYSDDPDFVDRQYQVPSISELTSMPGVVGVARFIEFPSFDPERLFTLVYRIGSMEVSAAIGASSLWHTFPSYCIDSKGQWHLDEVEPFEPSRAQRRSSLLTLPSGRCPALFRTWESVRDAAAGAGNCDGAMLDGMSYRHRVAGPGFDLVANWHNPLDPEHAPQIAIFKAYRELLTNLRLYAL